MWMWSDIGPVLPWLITSVSVAYVAYIHYKIRKQLKQLDPNQSKVNPGIDKHTNKVKHVFRGEHLEKEEINRESESTDNKTDVKTDTDVDYEDDDLGSEGGRPRGRRSAYSYFVSECAENEWNPLCQSSRDRRMFAEFAKKCAHNWKKLSEEEKQHFHQLSEEDKQRYEQEMKTYRKQQKMAAKHSSKSSKNVLPKKVKVDEELTDEMLNMAFDMYANEEMPIVRTQRPSIDTNNEEILTELLNRWNKSDELFKNKYLDRIRHQSMAFNKSFSQSIRDDDESSVVIGVVADSVNNSPPAINDDNNEDNNNVRCNDGINCGSDDEFGGDNVVEEDSNLNSKSSKV